MFRQRGFATLFVVLVLLVCMTTISLTVSRSGMMEQAISGNGVRAQEVQNASEAALDYAIAWWSVPANLMPTLTAIPICCYSNKPSAPGCPTLPSDLQGNDGQSNGGGYFKLSIQVVPITPTAPATTTYYNIIATATQSNNNSQAVTSCTIPQNTSPNGISCLPGTWVDFCTTSPCSACTP